MSRFIGVFAVVLLLSFLFLAGCSSRESATTAESVAAAPSGESPSQETSASPPAVQEESEKQIQEKLLKTAKVGSLWVSSKNWDEDVEEDGIIVYPDLRDSEGQTVKFENYPLNVAIEIWTTKYDDSYNEIKDRMIYSGTSTIDSWKDGNFMFEGGIRIPFENIKSVASDAEYGLLYTKISLPDGRIIEAKDDTARIKPEPE